MDLGPAPLLGDGTTGSLIWGAFASALCIASALCHGDCGAGCGRGPAIGGRRGASAVSLAEAGGAGPRRCRAPPCRPQSPPGPAGAGRWGPGGGGSDARARALSGSWGVRCQWPGRRRLSTVAPCRSQVPPHPTGRARWQVTRGRRTRAIPFQVGDGVCTGLRLGRVLFPRGISDGSRPVSFARSVPQRELKPAWHLY